MIAYYISCPDLYLEWLCHFWAAAAKSRETRVSLLPMMCLELTPVYLEEADDLPETSDEDDPQYSAFVQSVKHTTLKAIHIYDEYSAMSREICAVPFLTEFDLKCALDNHEKMHGPLTQETYDDYLEQSLGQIDWDRIKW